MSSVIGIIYDVKHLLLEIIEKRLLEKEIIVKYIHWSDIIYSNMECEVFEEINIVYLDRMGETVKSYDTQLLLLEITKKTKKKLKFINNPIMYYISRNKILMYLNLKKNKIPIPKTYILSNLNELERCFDELKSDYLIAKPFLGCCGEGIEIIAKGEKISKNLNNIIKTDGVIIIQEFINNPDKYIWRIDIVNGEIIQCNQRFSYNTKEKLPLCNGTVGGEIKIWDSFNLPEQVKKLAQKAIKALELSVAGIDILVSANNELFVCEINPEPDITQNAVEFPQKIADYLIEESCKIHI